MPSVITQNLSVTVLGGSVSDLRGSVSDLNGSANGKPISP